MGFSLKMQYTVKTFITKALALPALEIHRRNSSV